MAVPAGAAPLPVSSVPLAPLRLASLPLAALQQPHGSALPVLPPLPVHQPRQQQIGPAEMPLSAGLAAALASQPVPSGLVMQPGQLPAARMPVWKGSTILHPTGPRAVRRMPSLASSNGRQKSRQE